ncbi:Uncharacterised protein [Bacteroides pyogenes]|nr:Uncharacterised protein [Bacteroides pyogenes]
MDNLQFSQKCLPLQCVFHSIRFKVNKGWSTAVLLFLCPYVSLRYFFSAQYTPNMIHAAPSRATGVIRSLRISEAAAIVTTGFR